MSSQPDETKKDEHNQEFFEKFTAVLRSDGFTEMQIAKITTAVRRTLGL